MKKTLTLKELKKATNHLKKHAVKDLAGWVCFGGGKSAFLHRDGRLTDTKTGRIVCRMNWSTR